MSKLLFDTGGTHMRMAAGDGDVIQNVRKINTPAEPHRALAQLSEYAKEFAGSLDAVSGGVAAVLEDGVIRTSAHLPQWNGFDLKNELARQFDVPVLVRNDAEIAALGEAKFGAGKGYNLVAYIGIGTGVGGALVENGEIAPHAEGFEPGHQIIGVEKSVTLEELVSGSGLAQRFGKIAKDLPYESYLENTPMLATGLYNILLTWSPEILILGGALVNEKDGYHMGDIMSALNELPHVFPSMPPIVPAVLGDDRGLYGALVMPS